MPSYSHDKAKFKPKNRPQAPHVPFQRNSISNDILALWQTWLALEPKPALDRWLKQQRPSQQSVVERLAVHDAMISAQRFQQLACALEDGFEQKQELELTSWDVDWNEFQLLDIDSQAFWFWIEMRTGSHWGFGEQISFTDERKAMFRAWQANAKQQPLSALGLLWHGLRPSWQPLLEQRAQLSQWTETEFATFIRQQANHPPLWLRLNALQSIDHAAALEQLSAAGVHAHLKEGYLCATGGSGVPAHELHRTGVVEIQDLASQQVVDAMQITAGDKIWDCCAGAGGKTLAIATQLRNKGAVIATDLHEYKLDELKRRAKRAGTLNIRTFGWDGAEPLRLPHEIARQGGFDKILVDAPCSATGTWRRNPDARWHFDNGERDELLATQQRLLRLAAQSLRANGTLIYATCSWLAAENEDQVAAFIAHSGFELVEQKMLGAPKQDSDTLFVAVLKKP